MSGGSMNYQYSKVLHCADFSLDTPEREAFAKHLKLVAQALHDIEWVDSGDYGPGDENAAIRACLNPAPPQQVEPVAQCSFPACQTTGGCAGACTRSTQSQPTPSMVEIHRLRAERDALAERLREVRTQLNDTIDAHRQKKVMNAWAEQKLARHGVPMPEAPTCPDCHGIGKQAEPERHFCERCGKRLSQDGVHTCTPPQQIEQALLGVWQDVPGAVNFGIKE